MLLFNPIAKLIHITKAELCSAFNMCRSLALTVSQIVMFLNRGKTGTNAGNY